MLLRRTSMPHAVIGFHCSHEQYSPSELLRHAKTAADAGFVAGMCSDHFHPWSDRQGQSGFAWSWLGAALEGTPLSFGTVCAPGQRYHPAVIAQASATIAEMFEGRFWLAIGSGEALNETITGQPWPAKADRNARLKDSADAIRRLWGGEMVSMHGQVTVAGARLYTKPRQCPRLFAAALSPATARWAASWADGLITVAGPRGSMRAVVDAFRDGGGEGKPVFLQVTLSYAPSEDEAVRFAYAQWRHSALDSDALANLSTPAEFDRACNDADVADVVTKVRTSADINRHIDWLHRDCELGFDRIYLHNVARKYQDEFIDVCGTRILPEFSSTCVESG
jgi:coenzyme F420-dependent glucose-6-phosphate dehydrogenase